MMQSYAESGGFKDAVQFSCVFQSTGVYTPTFSSTENDDGSPGAGGGGTDPLPVARGSQNIIGLNGSGVGDIPAITPVYNFSNGEIYVYQRVCIFDETSTELTDYRVTAISNGYAICISYENEYSRGNDNKILIAPYKADTNILERGDWEVTDYLTIGVDINYINLGNNLNGDPYIIIGLFMLAPNLIMVQTSGQQSPNSGGVNGYSGLCKWFTVEFSSPTSFEINEYTLNLADYGDIVVVNVESYNGWGFLGLGSISFDTEIKRLSAKFSMSSFPGYAPGLCLYRLQYDSGAVITKEAYGTFSELPTRPLWNQTDWKCMNLKQLGEEAISEGIVDFVGGNFLEFGFRMEQCAFNHKRVVLGNDGQCSYFAYDSRTITYGEEGSSTQNGQLNYVSESEENIVDMQTQLNTKLASLSLAPIDFGQQAIYFDINI